MSWGTMSERGRIYFDNGRIGENSRFKPKKRDLLLSVRHWGDCLHEYAILEYNTFTKGVDNSPEWVDNETAKVYFNIVGYASGYGPVDEAFINMVPFAPDQLLDAVLTKQILVPMKYVIGQEEWINYKLRLKQAREIGATIMDMPIHTMIQNALVQKEMV